MVCRYSVELFTHFFFPCVFDHTFSRPTKTSFIILITLHISTGTMKIKVCTDEISLGPLSLRPGARLASALKGKRCRSKKTTTSLKRQGSSGLTEPTDRTLDDDSSVYSVATTTTIASMTTSLEATGSLLSLSSKSSSSSLHHKRSRKIRFQESLHDKVYTYAWEEEEPQEEASDASTSDIKWYTDKDIEQFKANEAYTRKMVCASSIANSTGGKAGYGATLTETFQNCRSTGTGTMPLEQEHDLFQAILNGKDDEPLQVHLRQQVQLWSPSRIGLERSLLKATNKIHKIPSADSQRREIRKLWQNYYHNAAAASSSSSWTTNSDCSFLNQQVQMIRVSLQCQAISRPARLFALRLALAQREEVESS